jgi:D-alanine-D-alanine ligase
VLFGGRSGEHPISCVTASGVLAAVDRDAFDVVAVGIDAGGRWWLVDGSAEPWRQHGQVLPRVSGDSPGPHGGPAVPVVPSTEVGGLRLLPLEGGEDTPVDVVFPLLHGPYGEDGTIQGLLDLAGARYVGSGVLSSAAGMDKQTMKTLLRAAGLPVADWVSFTVDEWRDGDRTELLARIDKLGRPVFVKPCRAGSSLGVARVADPGDLTALDAAVAGAAEHDPRLLVEAAVPGREVECAVLHDGPGSEPLASECGEIVLLGGREFYDFDAKYLEADAVRLDCPADLPPATADRVREVAVAAFEALQCEGLARVDVFVDGATVVVNEVNTMPGFTPISMYPRMWQASGIGYGELVDRLLRAALARPVGLR